MKNLMFVLAVFSMVSLSSCDNCKDVTCQNAGTCDEGICDCLPGFSGESCETEDKCISEAIDCRNGGVCNDGTCDCQDGYSGDDCGDEDKCITTDLECQNGGQCLDGACDCADGYEGDSCQTATPPESADFAGEYVMVDSCTVTGNDSYTITITSEGTKKINIEGLFLNGAFDADIAAKINGFKVTIEEQEPDNDGVEIKGTGKMNHDKTRITFDYTITNPDLTQDYCNGAATKK